MEKEEIRYVQARYHQLNLTPEQAEKVLIFEDMRDSGSRTHIFSAWEMWDFELSVLQDILSKDQMLQYQQRIEEMQGMHIENLVEQDNMNRVWADQMREKTDYLKNELIPSILSDIPRFAKLSMGRDRSKIDYLKAYYKAFLFDRRKQILVDHFRFNKTYAPIQLKSALRGHYASCLLPNYAAFERWADEPTRAVAGSIKSKLSRWNSEVSEFYIGKLREFKAFSEQLFEKCYQSTELGAVWRLDPLPEEEENTNWLMSLVLLDVRAYGFEPID